MGITRVSWISSNMTFFYKRLFPTFWFGFIALFPVIALSSGKGLQQPMMLAVPIFMATGRIINIAAVEWIFLRELRSTQS